jgi:gliding motility-associated-like protein
MSIRVKVALLVICLCCSHWCRAMHVMGGYIQYVYNGVGSASGTSNYTITVTVYYSCTTSGPKTDVGLGIFNASTGALVASKTINTTTSTTITKTTYSPCMSNPPSICYEVYTYQYSVDLPNISAGYILAIQSAYRTSNIVNISGSSADGITINAVIPGTIGGVDYHTNSSPTFVFNDTAIVCYNGTFQYPFNAVDNIDHDSLSYSFGNGLNVQDPGPNVDGATPSSPPYPSLTYLSGYSGGSPLGSAVSINPVTGLISGTAPATTGVYVVAVYVKEWRKGVLIDSIKKELQIYVFDCVLSAASLKPSYVDCDNYTLSVENESAASNITSYYWNFGVPGLTNDTSTEATPTYTYADTGTYVLKLRVSSSTGCTDSASSTVKIYPGFAPAFTYTGSCYAAPFLFKDSTIAKYGTVNSWAWNFGESASSSNTSTVADPSHQYVAAGNYTVTLDVGSSKGCTGIATETVTADAKPDFTLPFTDTLICSIDSLALIANSGSAGITYSWSPAYNIIDAGTANPTVFPQDTTVYTVTATQNGCVSTDSVTVNVLKYITVTLIPDTTICKTDSFQLHPVSYALGYRWTPGSTLSDSTIKYPKAAPLTNTTYMVLANLGKCQDSAFINVVVVPYPVANAGVDTTICYGTDAVLHGTMTAAYFQWTPTADLYNTQTLDPVAHPISSTNYVLTVSDTLGCPKSVSDTVLVEVVPQVLVSVGDDTTIVVGQPLYLHATSTDSALVSYSWTPATWLNNSDTQDPIALITSGLPDTITYTATATTPQGCSGYGSIKVTIYETRPDMFMPGAFTPNGDGNNDTYKPILVGMQKVDYFRIFNRWGQMVYFSTSTEASWDGTYDRKPQATGAYVYEIQAVDYLGAVHTKKGTIMLMR